MADIWVTSDTHFNHNNIIRYCNRPFADYNHMNEVLIERWNAVVKPQDKIYHLGDFYIGYSVKTILSRLNGHKRLILGNHDNGKDQDIQRHFEKISMWRMFPEFKLILTHVPIHESSFRHKCELNVHGHTHDKGSPEGPYKCVCVELTNYTPVNIEELRIG